MTDVRLPLVSASQITTYRECARKWAWRYLQGVETPQHPSAALGQEVDDTQLQPYLRDGRPLDLTRPSGYIAQAGIEYLPAPKAEGLQVQKHFVMPSPTWVDGKHIGFGFQGYLDLWLPDSAGMPGMPGGAPLVGDFKTTGDFRWVKSESVLRKDVQAMLYATHALFETRAKEVDLAWVYFRTKQPWKATRTALRVGANEVAQQFGEINQTAIEMFETRKANPHPLELTPNVEMCDAYGGCPHRGRCNLSPAQIIEATEARELRLSGTGVPSESGSMSDANELLTNLRKRKAGASAPVAAPKPDAVAAKYDRDGREAIANEPSAAPPADPRYDIVITRTDGSNVYRWEAEGMAAPINPPESTLPPPPLVTATEAATTEAPKKRGRPAKAANAGLVPVVDVDSAKLVRIAKAVRAAADAFLAAMEAA